MKLTDETLWTATAEGIACREAFEEEKGRPRFNVQFNPTTERYHDDNGIGPACFATNVEWDLWRMSWQAALLSASKPVEQELRRIGYATLEHGEPIHVRINGVQPETFAEGYSGAPVYILAASHAAPAQSADPVASARIGTVDVIAGRVRSYTFEQTDTPDGSYSLYTTPQPSPSAVVLDDERAAFENALFELVNKIDTGLDTGDLLKDATRASAALDLILSHGDLVACAHEYFRDSGERYEKSIEFRIGWNACLDAIANARAAFPQPVAQPVEQTFVCAHKYVNGQCTKCGCISAGE